MSNSKKPSRRERQGFQWRNVDPKEIVHYYVDGGIKDGKSASVFVRKGFAMKTKAEARRVFSHKVTSTKSEIRAVRLAMEDAIASGLNPENVVIHTDQKALVYNAFRRASDMMKLRDDLDAAGFNLAYIPSTHDLSELEGIDKEKIPKKVLNALQVHNLVGETLSAGHNRYRYHLMKKRNRKRKKKRW